MATVQSIDQIHQDIYISVFCCFFFFQENAKFYQCEEDLSNSAGRQDVLSWNAAALQVCRGSHTKNVIKLFNVSHNSGIGTT